MTGIRIESEGGKLVPRICCAVCMTRIDEADEATVCWRGDSPERLMVVHFGSRDCLGDLEESADEETVLLDIPLPAFLTYLEENLSFNRSRAKAQARALTVI